MFFLFAVGRRFPDGTARRRDRVDAILLRREHPVDAGLKRVFLVAPPGAPAQRRNARQRLVDCREIAAHVVDATFDPDHRPDPQVDVRLDAV